MPSLSSDFAHGTVWVWLVSLAFCAGGLANAVGPPKIQAMFEQLGFPGWWCRVTAALEILTALLLLWPSCLLVGITLGASIMAVAIAAVLRARLYGHLPPPILFMLFLVLAGCSRAA